MNENHNGFNEMEIEKKPMMQGKNKKLIAVLVSAVLVVALGIVGASVLFSSPLTLVGTGLANSAKAIGNNEMVTLLEKYSKGGSAQIEIGLEGILEAVLGIGIDATAAIKIYSDGENGAAVAADMTVRDNLFLDASIVASKTDVVVTSQKLLGDAAYGVDLMNASENFEGSVFGPTGPFSIGLESVEEITDNIAQSEQMKENVQEIGESFSTVLFRSLKQNAKVGKENKTLDFNGEKVKTTAVRVELDSEALANIFADLIEYIYTNEELEQFLRTYDTMVADYLAGVDLISYYDDSEEFVDDLYDSLEEIYTDLNDYKDQIVDSGAELSVVFYVTKSDKELVGVDVSAEFDGEEASVSVLAGPTLSDLREVKIKVDDGLSVIHVGYNVEVNDKVDYAARFTVREDDVELASGNVVWDKKSGAYAIGISDDLCLEGGFELNEQSATLTLDKITSGSGYVEMVVDLSIQINASDKMPAMPKDYTDVLTMSQYDIENLTADMATALMNEVYSLDSDMLSILQYLMWYFI